MVACIDWSSWSEGPAAALRSTVFGPLAEIAKAAQAVTEDAGAGNLRSRLRDEDADGRAVLLERYLVSKVAGILETTPQRLDAERPLVQMGLDSLMAVELMTAMQNDLGVSVALADLLQSVSLSDLTRLAVDSLASATAA